MSCQPQLSILYNNLVAFTYQKSGVNYSLMDPFKNAALKLSGFPSELVEFPNFYLVDVLEAVGSLNKLAEDIFYKTGQDFYYQVGWSNAATILNDLAMTGAKPKTLKLFVAVGSQNWFADPKRWQPLLLGFSDAAKHAGASWNGGETQTLTGIINPKSIVLAGSSTGIIEPKSNLISDEKLKDNDRIILFWSSGVHTNGITLIRKIFKDEPKILIEAIKNKTIIYSPLIEKLLDNKIEIHYATHITGHGWKKIMRAKQNFTYIIEKIPRAQTIFQKIQQRTNMSLVEMYGDYNMGAGLALFVPKSEVSKVMKIATQMKVKALDAGYITKGSRKLIIEPFHFEFKGKSLRIR